MASGDTLCVLGPAANQPPAASFAVPNLLNSELELDFTNSAASEAVFRAVMPRNYAANGLTVRIHWTSSVTSGNVIWSVSFERMLTGTDTYASDSFASAQTATTAAPGSANVGKTSDVVFTDGGQMDSIAAGETFRMKLRRTTGGSDTLAGTCKVFAVEIKET